MLNYDQIVFPVFTVHTDNVEISDGILWVEDQVLDDRNMKGKTLGIRRLQSPMKSIYPLKYMIEDIPSLLIHRGKQYIDSAGHYFVKEKTTKLKRFLQSAMQKIKDKLKKVLSKIASLGKMMMNKLLNFLGLAVDSVQGVPKSMEI